MKKITIDEYTPDAKLRSLLQQRKAPLAQPAMQKTLQELTAYMTEDITFLLAAFLKKELSGSDEITAYDISKADIMIASDGERYLPVFTDPKDFLSFKPKLLDGESLLLCRKKDLLAFLDINEKVAAAVINPMNDDLILYRVNLRNLIQVEQNR